MGERRGAAQNQRTQDPKLKVIMDHYIEFTVIPPITTETTEPVEVTVKKSSGGNHCTLLNTPGHLQRIGNELWSTLQSVILRNRQLL